MSSVDLLWTAIVSTLVIVMFAGAFIAVIIRNQRRFILVQKEKLSERKKLEDVLRMLPKQIIEAQEEERRRVAKELHDGINQMLASIKYRFHTVNIQDPPDREALREWMLHLSNDLEYTMEEVKRISHNLHPKILDDLGFSSAVRSLCEEFLEHTHMIMHCEIGELSVAISQEAQIGVYRIIQEALHNIEKHAHATSVTIQTSQRDSSLVVKIHDNGHGFDVNKSLMIAPGKHQGLGLTTMEERAKLIGGIFKIYSSPTEGTLILVKVPLQ